MVTKVGPERAMMKHPDAQAGFLVRGSANIDAMLAKGWVILVCDRNHLLPERMTPEQPAEQPTDQPKRGPGRPRKVANNNK